MVSQSVVEQGPFIARVLMASLNSISCQVSQVDQGKVTRVQNFALQIFRDRANRIFDDQLVKFNALRDSFKLGNIIVGGKALDISFVKLMGDAQEVVVHFLHLSLLDCVGRLLEPAQDASIFGIDRGMNEP